MKIYKLIGKIIINFSGIFILGYSIKFQVD